MQPLNLLASMRVALKENKVSTHQRHKIITMIGGRTTGEDQVVDGQREVLHPAGLTGEVSVLCPTKIT